MLLHEIPKLMHFIWVGDKKLMPDQNIENVLQLMKSNPNCKVWLWVDEKSHVSLYGSREACLEQYWAKIKQQAKTLSLNFNKLKKRISFQYIEDKRLVDEYVRYELYRLRPNYGAASDLLRYKISYKYGGIYLDADVQVGEQSFEKLRIFSKRLSHHVLWVDPNCLGSGGISNDVLCCTKNNPLIKEMYNTAIRNYQAKRTKNDRVQYEASEVPTRQIVSGVLLGEIYYRGLYGRSRDESKNDLELLHTFVCGSESKEVLLNATVARTGPKCARSVLMLPLLLLTNKVQKNRALQTWGKTLYLPKTYRHVPDKKQARSLGSWINLYVRHFDKNVPNALQEAINLAIESIKFEINHLKILRIDDHIGYLIKSLDIKDQNEVERIAQLFIDALIVKIPKFDGIKVGQLTFRYDTSVKFYKDYQLLEKIFLFPELTTDDKLVVSDFVFYHIERMFHWSNQLPLYCGFFEIDEFDKMDNKRKIMVAGELLKLCKSFAKFVGEIRQYFEKILDKLEDVIREEDMRKQLLSYFEALESSRNQLKEYCSKFQIELPRRRVQRKKPLRSSRHLLQDIKNEINGVLAGAEKIEKEMCAKLNLESKVRPGFGAYFKLILTSILSFLFINLSSE